MTPRYACNLAPGCISSEPTFAGLRKSKKKKTRGPKKRGPRKKGKRGFLWQSLTSLEMQPGAKLRRISRGHYFAASRLKIKLFPTTEYSSKQSSDPVVPLVPCTGIFLGASKSGKTVALISLILEQYRGVFERIYVFSPSVNIDDGWIPVKKYIEGDLGVNTEREQTYWDEWDEAALRRIIQQQRKITEASKKLEMKKLYQVLVVIDDFADTPQLHKPHGALDTLFIRGRHMQISTWVSSQKLRLISAAVRVNMQFLCCWRLRNQHELDAVIEELSALLPKEQLYRLYEQATREPYSFLFVYYLKPRNEMFYKRFEERFALEKDADGSGAQLPGPEAFRQLHADQR